MNAIEFRVAFHAREFDRSVHFYQETLGLERTGGWDRPDGKGALFSVGGNAVIEIFGAAEGETYDGPVPADVVLAIEIEDVDGLYEQLIALGADVQDKPVNRPWGHRVFTVKDPDGLSIHLYSVIEE